MTAQPHRFTAPVPREPILHELSPLLLCDQSITLHLTVRRAEDGAWRARLRFVDPDERTRETAEIFCGATEAELWQSVHNLGQHHLRALYLSLA
jgi:hypothetical protein